MLLRHLLHHWLRHSAQQKLREALSGSVRETNLERETAAPGDQPAPAEFGLVFALGIEAGGFLDRLSDVVVTRGRRLTEHTGLLEGRRTVVVQSGVGHQLAEDAALDMVQVHRPRWVISTGFSGALSAEVRRGDIVMANQLVDSDNNSLSVELQIDPQALAESPGVHLGRLLTVDQLVRRRDERLQLGSQYGALAVDMESFAVACVCRREKTRFLAIRAISDGVDDRLPAEIDCLLDQKTMASRLGAVTGALFRRPSVAKDMWKLKEVAMRTSDRLATFLVSMMSQLPDD